jgi:hypothetical protein
MFTCQSSTTPLRKPKTIEALTVNEQALTVSTSTASEPTPTASTQLPTLSPSFQTRKKNEITPTTSTSKASAPTTITITKNSTTTINTNIRINGLETDAPKDKELPEQHMNQVQINSNQVAKHAQNNEHQISTTASTLIGTYENPVPNKIATANNADMRVENAITATKYAPVVTSQPLWLVAKTRATTTQNSTQSSSAFNLSPNMTAVPSSTLLKEKSTTTNKSSNTAALSSAATTTTVISIAS